MNARIPTVTAIIPAYNSGEFLNDALQSIANQTVPVLETIVVDDGSTDNTTTIAQAHDIKLVKQANAGPSSARNRGIALARGEFIAFLDADDQWTPTKIADQLSTIERHENLALVASDMAETNRAGDITEPSMLSKHHLHRRFAALDGAPQPNAMAALVRKNFIPTGTVLVRTDAVREVGGFNTGLHFAEDLELWVKIAARHPITCLAQVHMLRRQHESNATRSDLPMLEGVLSVVRSIAGWGGEELRRQGIDPSQLIAESASNVGYWHFANEDLFAAKAYFAESLRERVTKRALAYWLASQLPQSWVRRTRQIKQQVSSSGTSE